MRRRLLVLSTLLTLAVACGDGSSGASPDVPADQAADGAVDPGSTPDGAGDVPGVPDGTEVETVPGPDAGPDVADAVELPPHDVGAETPSEVEGSDGGPTDVVEVAPEVLEPVCEGAWAPVEHETAADATFLRGPFLQAVEGDGATIAWRLAPPAVGEPEPAPQPGCVRYAVDGGAEQEACDDPDESRQYAVHLSGLPASAHVRYRVAVGEVETADLEFFAAPVDAAPVRLMVFSDAHINPDTLPLLASRTLADGVDFAVSVGDHVNSPEVAQFDTLFDLLRPLLAHVCWWPTIGNHEGRDDLYFDSIEVPGEAPNPGGEAYYAARVGSVWFASLELKDILVSAMLKKDLGEVTWLREQLASPAARTATWRLFFLHEPPWSQGWSPCDYNGEVLIRDLVSELATQGGVAAVFSGHTHDYEHGVVDGVHYFINGGAGGSLDLECPVIDGFPQPWTTALEHHRLVLDASCDNLVIEARRLSDDGVIDRVEIAPVPVP